MFFRRLRPSKDLRTKERSDLLLQRLAQKILKRKYLIRRIPYALNSRFNPYAITIKVGKSSQIKPHLIQNRFGKYIPQSLPRSVLSVE